MESNAARVLLTGASRGIGAAFARAVAAAGADPALNGRIEVLINNAGVSCDRRDLRLPRREAALPIIVDLPRRIGEATLTGVDHHRD